MNQKIKGIGDVITMIHKIKKFQLKNKNEHLIQEKNKKY